MHEDLVGATIAGRYRVVRKLGEGGMGTVYVAVQEPLGREVALKVIRADLTRDPGAVERFKREATTLSQLAHPNVVTIFDFGLADGVLFLAMELLRGETLRMRVQARGALSPAETLPIIRDVASGLAVAHAGGVIHRDLKPDNVMLVAAFGRTESAKILDFGVAKLASPQSGATLTQAGMIVGTPGYMAPELALEGVLNDPRSDLYALGVIWFEMLAGRALFEATTPVALLMKHATQEPARPSAFMNGIGSDVEALVMRLLAKSPDGRPPSAEELVREIDALDPSAPSALTSPAPSPAARPAPQARAAHVDPIGTAPTMARPAPAALEDEPTDAAIATAMPRRLGMLAAGTFLVVLLIAGAVGALLMKRDVTSDRAPPAKALAKAAPLVAPSPPVVPSAPPVVPSEPPVVPSAPVVASEPAASPTEAPAEAAAPATKAKPKPKPKKPVAKQPARVPELED